MTEYFEAFFNFHSDCQARIRHFQRKEHSDQLELLPLSFRKASCCKSNFRYIYLEYISNPSTAFPLLTKCTRKILQSAGWKTPTRVFSLRLQSIGKRRKKIRTLQTTAQWQSFYRNLILKWSSCLQDLSAITSRRRGYPLVSSNPGSFVVAPAVAFPAPYKSIREIESSWKKSSACLRKVLEFEECRSLAKHELRVPFPSS